MSDVICHTVCQMSYVKCRCRMPYVGCRMSYVISNVKCHMSDFGCLSHMSYDGCKMSYVGCQMSNVTCHMSAVSNAESILHAVSILHGKSRCNILFAFLKLCEVQFFGFGLE